MSRERPEIKSKAKEVGNHIYEIDKSAVKNMRVPSRLYASPKLFESLDPGVFMQITNVAKLPGIVSRAMAMPDAHWGYGFPIGGVAAFNHEEGGVISPGGIGFDINCGMRLISTNLTVNKVKPKIRELMNHLFELIPAGVGKKGFIRLNTNQFREVAENGSSWCVENGYGWEEDKERQESLGKIPGANLDTVSERARSRGIKQLGTLGSGNHYCEVQKVNQILDEEKAKIMGITNPNQIVIMVHCGSRGFGHQIATDYLKLFLNKMESKWKIPIYEKELAAAPFHEKEGQEYYSAMACAANMAFANRQVILHQVRKGFSNIFRMTPEEMEMHLVYDVAHNIAKVEEHDVEGKKQKLIVHRKGATRSFGPGSPDIPNIYQKTGQPVILGGSMETGSYLLAGTQKAVDETFGSTAHGSGRRMSRSKAKRRIRGDKLKNDMAQRGIYVRAASMAGLAEEAGFAYKNISDVVKTLETVNISKRVAQLVPLGNIKG
ncbi:MAG: RtcB family protein [Candidatus Hodarchaeales archaeon]|jgi:tRNA-splicing ligase RtcB